MLLPHPERALLYMQIIAARAMRIGLTTSCQAIYVNCYAFYYNSNIGQWTPMHANRHQH